MCQGLRRNKGRLSSLLPFLATVISASIILTGSLSFVSFRQAQAAPPIAGSAPAELEQASSSGEDTSYILLRPDVSEILLSQNASLRRAPASTTKLLTGLVALQKLQPDEQVTVGGEVLLEGSALGLRPGDRITVHQLLSAMYVLSANDAAAALAVKAAGSIEAFAAAMNKYANNIGLRDSHFTNPHGLPDPDHYTTAADLAKIAQAFIQNQELLTLAQQAKATIEWVDSSGRRRAVSVRNTNKLLSLYPGVQGLKTGTTTAAGQCLVIYFTSQEGDMLLVVLGAKQRYATAVPLLDKGLAQLRLVNALKGFGIEPSGLLHSPGIF